MSLFKNKNFNIISWEFIFLNTKFTITPKKYKKWLKKPVNNIFEKNDWTLKKIIHFFPFLFGFSQMVWYQYNDETFLLLFEKTIPGVQAPKETFSWNLFQNIKTKNIQNNEIKKIDFYDNYFLLQLNQKKQKNFIGTFQNRNNNNLNLIYYKIFFDDFKGFFPRELQITPCFQNDFFYGNFYYKLDEFPLKLEESYPFSKETTNFSFFKNQDVNKIQKQKNFSIKKERKKQQKNNLELNFLKDSFLEKFTKNKGFAFQQQTSNKSLSNKNKLFFSTKLKILQKELDNFFYKKGFCHVFLTIKKNQKIKKLKKNFKFFNFKKYSSNQTFDLVDSFFSVQKSKKIYPKFVSGYIYPNLSLNKTKKLGFQYTFKQKNSYTLLKIDVPPCLLFFWENDLWIPSLLFNKRIITDKKTGFFGIPLNNLESSLNKEKNWKQVLNKEIRKNKTRKFYNFKHIEFFSDVNTTKNWSNFEQKHFEKDSLIYYKSKNFQKTKNNQEKFFNILYYLQYKSTKIKKHFIPFSETYINNNIVNKKIFDLIYKKRQNLVKLNQKKDIFQFFECYEPLSSKSWMIITQISICFFIIQLLKDFYKDYGKELIEYLLESASSSNIDLEKVKEQYLYDDPDKGYRIIKKVNKGFQDIAGIDNLLPTLGEIVWFLRNPGKSLKFKKSIPKGILLVGPPGTGKTLLVQALAGEAQIPVLVESGSLLTDPQQKITGVKRLKNMFDQARQIAPCIVFIDEVDTLGETRQKIIQTPMGTDEIIESLSSAQSFEGKDNFLPKPLNLEDTKKNQYDLDYDFFRKSEKDIDFGLGKIQQIIEKKKTRLSILMQFLVEMDGLKQREKILVIGATNRPTVLDPALVRPGRFDQILNLELPGKQKRLEILKFYSEKLTIEKKISWNYLANRTKGFSAADIAAIMNQSALQAIFQKTIHNLETIERGIDLITNYNLDFSVFDSKKKTKDPFYIIRLAYYQSGKAILHSILPTHPPVVFLNLLSQAKNTRRSQKFFIEKQNQFAFEMKLIGLYSGKAAELLTLHGNKNFNFLKRWQSDIGFEELLLATFITNVMIDKCYFYSKKIVNRKNHYQITNRNEKEYLDFEKTERIYFFQEEIEDEIAIEKIAKIARIEQTQQRAFGPWWQIQITKQTSEIASFFADWYRLYLPDPEESLLNLEWIPPDEYYHSNDFLKKISKDSKTTFNDLYKIERDFIYQGLILNSFNNAFCFLEENREFLDYFSDLLIRYEIIRQNQISSILNKKKGVSSFIKEKSKNNQDIQITEKIWGKNSRRKYSRFISIKSIKMKKNK
uniref:Cell division protein n=1 Tax=Neglectella solitaria TaxID=120749 RepID=C7BED3_NEGSO|nr:cell division protein [Neglectella solitaria]